MDNKGYTLLEMLVVLMIVMIIFYVMFICFTAFNSQMNLNFTIDSLGSDYQMLQTMSVANMVDGQIILNDDSYEVYSDDESILKREYQPCVTQTNNFTDSTININNYGNISRGGTITFTCSSYTTQMIFSIGDGRYRIE